MKVTMVFRAEKSAFTGLWEPTEMIPNTMVNHTHTPHVAMTRDILEKYWKVVKPGEPLIFMSALAVVDEPNPWVGSPVVQGHFM